jgi:transcriptional regulator with XRE-family HTH domain
MPRSERQLEPGPDNQFARWLRAIAMASNFGVNALARELDMAPPSVSQLLNGKNYPSRPTRKKIAALFQVPERDILRLLPEYQLPGELPSSTIITNATGLIMIPVRGEFGNHGAGTAHSGIRSS